MAADGHLVPSAAADAAHAAHAVHATYAALTAARVHVGQRYRP
jgi:hypothetical protein